MMDPFPTAPCGNTARSACSRFPASRTVGVMARMHDQTSVQAPSTRLKVGRTGAECTCRRWLKVPALRRFRGCGVRLGRRGVLQQVASALDARSTTCEPRELPVPHADPRDTAAGSLIKWLPYGNGSDADSRPALE